MQLVIFVTACFDSSLEFLPVAQPIRTQQTTDASNKADWISQLMRLFWIEASSLSDVCARPCVCECAIVPGEGVRLFPVERMLMSQTAIGESDYWISRTLMTVTKAASTTVSLPANDIQFTPITMPLRYYYSISGSGGLALIVTHGTLIVSLWDWLHSLSLPSLLSYRIVITIVP